MAFDRYVTNEVIVALREEKEGTTIPLLYQDMEYCLSDDAFVEHCLDIFRNKFCLNLSKASDSDFTPVINTLREKLLNLTQKFRSSGSIDLINRILLRDLYKNEYEKPFLKTLAKDYQMSKREGLKGLLIAVVFRECFLISQRTVLEVDLQEGSALSQFHPHTITEELHHFLGGLQDIPTSSIELEEYIRLLRCQLVFSWLNKYHNAKNNKELFLFVAQLLEGVHDKFNRLYVGGGRPCRYRKIRERLFEKITGISKRDRTVTSKDHVKLTSSPSSTMSPEEESDQSGEHLTEIERKDSEFISRIQHIHSSEPPAKRQKRSTISDSGNEPPIFNLLNQYLLITVSK